MMDTADIQEQLDRATERLEEERIRAADLESALSVSELQVVGLEKRLAAGPSDDVGDLREQLARQAEAAEEYRVEAADLRSMFDAMQHRIDTLQKRAEDSREPAQTSADADAALAEAASRLENLEREKAELSANFDEFTSAAEAAIGGPASADDVRALGPLLRRAAEIEAGAADAEQSESGLRRALEEAESSLAATRKARDQWLERLEESGREKAELQRHLAELESRVAQSQEREAEVREVREQAERGGAELESLRADLEQARAERAQLESGMSTVRGELETAVDRARELQAALETERETVGHERTRIAELETAVDRGRELQAALDTERETVGQERARIAELETSVDLARELQAALDTERETVGQARTRIAELETSVDRARELQAALDTEREAVGQARTRIAELEAERSEVASDLDGARAASEASLEEVRTELEAERAKSAELEALLSEADRELAESKDSLAARDEADESASARIAELEGELKQERERLGEVESAARAGAEEVEGARAEAEANLAEARGELEAERTKTAELEALLSEQDRELSESQESLAARAEAGDSASARIAELEGELKQERERLGEVEAAAREGTEQLEERARLAETGRDEAASHLAAQEQALEGLVERVDLAARQSEELAGAQADLRPALDALTDEIEVAHQLSQELRSGVVDDRRVLSELGSRLGAVESIDGELKSACSRVEQLESEVATLSERLADRDGDREDEGRLREQLADLEAQRSALAEEVESERALRTQAEGMSEELRMSSLVPDNGDLEAQLASLRGRFDEAVTKHAEEARALRDESEIHKDLARQRETEMGKLSEECSILQQSVEDALTELDGVRAERHSLGEELSDMGDVAGGEDGAISALVRANGDAHQPEPTDGAAADNTETSSVADPDLVAALSAADPDLESGLSDDAEIQAVVGGGREMVVLGIDGDPVFDAAVEAAAARIDGARFTTDVRGDVGPAADLRLVVNLASENFDLEIFSKSPPNGLDEPEALVYCGKDGRGVFFRRVMFFPPPCDLDECSARLLAGSDSLQRLLAVGEDVDFMSGLRESLGKVRASTAIAFDGRQAVDLLPMVKPELLLVDLNLPRGEGLRVASQIAADPEQKHVQIAMFWSKPVDPLVFRQQAIYSLRDFQLEPARLTTAVTRELSMSVPASSVAAFARDPSRPAASA